MLASKFSQPPPARGSPSARKSSKMTNPPLRRYARNAAVSLGVIVQKPGLGHVQHRVLEQLGIVERHDHALVDVRVEVAQLGHNLHEALFRPFAAPARRIPVGPGRQAAVVVAARTRFVPDAGKRETAVVLHVANGRFALGEETKLRGHARPSRDHECGDKEGDGPAQSGV